MSSSSSSVSRHDMLDVVDLLVLVLVLVFLLVVIVCWDVVVFVKAACLKTCLRYETTSTLQVRFGKQWMFKHSTLWKHGLLS